VRIAMGAKGDFFSPKSIANRQKVCGWVQTVPSVLSPPFVSASDQRVPVLAQAKGLQKLRWYCQARAPPRARRRCSPRSFNSLCHWLCASLLAAVSETVPRRERVQVPHDERRPLATGECLQPPGEAGGAPSRTLTRAAALQMSIFGQNANKVVGDYSAEFESRFLEHCARSCVPLVLPLPLHT